MKYYMIAMVVFCMSLFLTAIVGTGLWALFCAVCTGNNKGWIGGRIIFSVLFVVFAPMIFALWFLWIQIIRDIP